MEKRSEVFGRHLKAGMASIAYLEGKTQQVIEEELGIPLRIAGVTLQRYKAGYLPSDPSCIELLAEACVQRGLLGRVWLEHFLDAARLPDSSKRRLMARLLPEQVEKPINASQSNLPAPHYRQFIMRSNAYRALLKSLQSEQPCTLLVSLSGTGKTCLAHRIASDDNERNPSERLFTSIVWISEKNRSNSINLNATLNEIARVLDYPGITLLPLEQRLREIEALLARQAVLIVIDKAETISDTTLLHWLNSLPPPSRALLTSRFMLPILSNAAIVELGPMNTGEIQAFVSDWLAPYKRHGLLGRRDEVDKLASSVGGNVKALELALGLLQQQSLAELKLELPNAKQELFKELLSRAWHLLDSASKMLLYSLCFFPLSASSASLAYCADLSLASCERHCELLSDLALLEQELHPGQPSRYSLHPLVHAFVLGQLACLPDYQQEQLRMRWLTWCLELASSVGYCWQAPERLAVLDPEYETIQSAILWAEDHRHDRVLIKLVEGIDYFYQMRGLWASNGLSNQRRKREAAQRLGDQHGLVEALARSVQILSAQRRFAEANSYLHELQQAVQTSSQALNDAALFAYQHALACSSYAQGDLAQAEAFWSELLVAAQVNTPHQALIYRCWLANTLLEQGHLESATLQFQAVRDDAEALNDTHLLLEGTLRLAQIALEEGRFEKVAAALESCQNLSENDPDRRHHAELAWVKGQFKQLQHAYSEAHTAYQQALDLFERLGLRGEAERVRADLQSLQHEQILLN
jgi:tetratricopeptide (TPR) repeat protein